MRSAVFTFGRFNPPTIGHMVLADKVKSEANKIKAQPFIFTGQTQDKKKNPLNHTSKTKYMLKAFRGLNVVNNTSIRTLFDALSYLDNKGFDNIIMVVGSDRVSSFKLLLKKYIKDYDFSTINVVSAGERDPDADGAKGMSASKMRAAAARDDYDAFLLGCPSTLSKADCLKMFKDIKGGMGVTESLEENWFNYEEYELFCEKVSLQTRKKMARAATRTAKRRAVTKKRKQKHRKSSEDLGKKARQEAKLVLRKKIIGDKNWSSMSLSQRTNIDAIIAKKGKGAISKIAKKLLPKVKIKEKERLQKLRTPDQPTKIPEGIEMNEMSEDKPLIKWVNALEKELKRLGSNYSKVKPTDALKLYYKGVDPKKAASELKESVSTYALTCRPNATLWKFFKSPIKEEQDTFRGKAIEKAKEDARTKKAEINVKIAAARGELEKSIAAGNSGDDLKNLKVALQATKEKRNALDRRLEASKARMKALRARLKSTNEEGGAGDEGTDKLKNRYNKETPNQ
jgi:hypothetical protein